ncbi:alpha/beta hydrolase family protein [Gordonia soli]|nr:alpha/beta hydrolase [Gordonia soli]
MTHRFCIAVLALVTAVAALGHTAVADAAPRATVVDETRSLTGPYRTAQTLDAGACTSLYGTIANGLVHVFGNTYSNLKCSQTFPNGLASPAGVALYYPTNTPSDRRLPVVIWTGGILSEPGNYDRAAKMLASNGYVVAIPYDFVNSFAYLPLIAAAAVSRANSDARSALHDRVDLGHVAIAGHSAGGAATQQAIGLPTGIWRLIDPQLRVRSAVAVEAGPVAIGVTATVPTLYLTGYNDVVVPHYLWARWTQYELTTRVPAYLLCARGTGHFTPTDDPEHNPLAPIMLSWLDHTLRDDPDAGAEFVGPRWRQRGNPDLVYALRNRAAASLTR